MKKFLLMMAAFFLIGAAWAQTTFSSVNDGKTIYYETISATEVKVTHDGDYSNGTYIGSIEVPPMVNHAGTTYVVTQIGENAFRGYAGTVDATGSNRLRSVMIPSTVAHIGNRAFYHFRTSAWSTIPLTITALPSVEPTIGTEVFVEGTRPFGVGDDRLETLRYPQGATYSEWNGRFLNRTAISTFTVTLDYAGGIATGMPNEFNVIDGYSISSNNLPIPTREGFSFLRWEMNGAAFATNSAWNAPVTLTAVWEQTTFTITYMDGDVQHGEVSTYSTTALPHALIPAVKPGYVGEWYANHDVTEGPITELGVGSTGDTTFYAKWEPAVYNVTYVENGGVELMDTTYKIDSEPLILATTTREGYQFGGWHGTTACVAEEATCTPITQIATGSYGDTTLYARWINNTYTIVFNINGGTSGAMADMQDVKYSVLTNLIPNTFERTGYTFLYWNTQADGLGTTYLEGQEVSMLTAVNGETVTLYAIWQEGECALEFDFNGGSSPAGVTPVVCTQPIFGQPLGNIFPEVVPPVGSTFIGWFIDGQEIRDTTIRRFIEPAEAVAHYFSAVEYKADCPNATEGQGQGKIKVTYTGEGFIPSIADLTITPTTDFNPETGRMEAIFEGLDAGTFNVVFAGGLENDTLPVIVNSFDVNPLVTAPETLLVQPNEVVMFVAEATGTAYPVVWTWNGEMTGVEYIHGMNIYNASFLADATVTARGSYTPAGGETCAFTLTEDVNVDVCLEQTTVADVQSNIYPIGGFANNCWTRENFKATAYSDNEPVLFAEIFENPEVETVPENHGRFYNWASAVRVGTPSPLALGKVQGVCPTGWRLPVEGDINNLSANYTSEELRGEGWIQGGEAGMEGFNALAVGRYNAGFDRYEKITSYTGFWTSTIQTPGNNAIFGELDYSCPQLQIEKENINANNGLSVRCVLVIEPEMLVLSTADNHLNGIFANGDYGVTGIQYNTDGGTTWEYLEVTLDPTVDGIFFNAPLTLTPGATLHYRPVVKVGEEILYTGETKTIVVSVMP